MPAVALDFCRQYTAPGRPVVNTPARNFSQSSIRSNWTSLNPSVSGGRSMES
jgi:hypothetical protein